ncbi:P-II family nitrogen regulator [Candidatus Saganbacteria bacterium]|nr:P-II family nitrogen regulator [Candidatus Saganbacteria bacterium]
MKLIKACVRTRMADAVIHALEKLNIPCLNASDVKVIGAEMKSEEAEEVSLEYGAEFVAMTKLEILCQDNEADRIVTTIRKSAHTGRAGDGMIITMPVEDAIKIHPPKQIT